MENKKLFINPSIEIVVINNDEIITTSLGTHTYDPDGMFDENGTDIF